MDVKTEISIMLQEELWQAGYISVEVIHYDDKEAVVSVPQRICVKDVGKIGKIIEMNAECMRVEDYNPHRQIEITYKK